MHVCFLSNGWDLSLLSNSFGWYLLSNLTLISLYVFFLIKSLSLSLGDHTSLVSKKIFIPRFFPLYMSCINKTACFSVNCASLPSSLDGIRNNKAQTGLVCRSSLIELHPQNWTWPNLAHKASANQRLFRH